MNEMPHFPVGLEALPDCALRPEAGRRVRVDDGRRQGRHGPFPFRTGKSVPAWVLLYVLKIILCTCVLGDSGGLAVVFG